MPSTFNLAWKIYGVINGALRKEDEQFTEPAIITTSTNDIILQTDIHFGAATTKVLADISTEAVCIIVFPTVSGTLAWAGENLPDTGSFTCLANVPFILPTGSTTMDASGATNRAATADSMITQIVYKSSSSGKVRLFIIA